MMEVRVNGHRNCVLVYGRTHQYTNYLGLEATQLTPLRKHTEEFEREYNVVTDKTPECFARAYIGTDAARKLIPISSVALRILFGIIQGQANGGSVHQLSHQEQSIMAEAASTFRKPGGPVASIHAFLDKKIDAIKAGTVSRKELIDVLVDSKGYNRATVMTQAGRWATTNGVAFVRPKAAAEAKVAQRQKARAKVAKVAAKANGNGKSDNVFKPAKVKAVKVKAEKPAPAKVAKVKTPKVSKSPPPKSFLSEAGAQVGL